MSRLFFIMAGIAIGIVLYLTRKQKESNVHGNTDNGKQA